MKSRFAKIAYGVGNLGQALFFNTVQTFLVAMRYYPLGKEQVVALRETLDALHREKAEQLMVRGGQEL